MKAGSQKPTSRTERRLRQRDCSSLEASAPSDTSEMTPTVDGNQQQFRYDKSMTMVSRAIVGVLLAELTMAVIDGPMLYSVEAGFARAINFGAFGVVAAELSHAGLWHLRTLDSSSNGHIAALCSVNMAHFRSHCDGSSELTCHGR